MTTIATVCIYKVVLEDHYPTEVTKGDPAGKSGWKVQVAPLQVPVRPHTPLSPDATRMDRPRAAACWNCWFTAVMYAEEVCCSSSLP